MHMHRSYTLLYIPHWLFSDFYVSGRVVPRICIGRVHVCKLRIGYLATSMFVAELYHVVNCALVI
jgi:hypothetical protein